MSDTSDMLRINERPTIRLKKALAYAMALYNEDTGHNQTQTITAALVAFLPSKYIKRGVFAAKKNEH
jgi:hypothetical protein